MFQCRIIPSRDIDPTKWDACVANNANGLIYAQYHYLTRLCVNWSALIIGNYDTILPLPWKRKWGIRYFYAPPFIQQLGLIGNTELITIEQLLKKLTNFARYGDLFWNYQNLQIATSFGAIEKTNFVVDLNQSHETIFNRYSPVLKQNIQKAKNHGLTYQKNDKFDKSLTWYQSQYGERMHQLSATDFYNFKIICGNLQQINCCLIREVVDPISKEALATAILLKDNKRLYLLINAISENGRKSSANHFLLDSIFYEFCEQKILFDFEGSELTGVAEFYKSFHPINIPYYHSIYNEFPLAMKWLIQKFH